MTTTITTGRSGSESVRKPRAELVALTAIHMFLAFISIVGSFLFSYPLGGIEGWTYGIGLDVAGVLMIVAAWNLPKGSVSVIKLARSLMIAEFAWCTYKVFIYGETESGLFFVASTVALILLFSGRVRRYVAAQS
jgi:hypothetical protein